MTIKDALKTAAEVKALPLDELAWVVLEYLKSTKDKKGIIVNKGVFAQPATDYGHDDVEVAQILMEAWESLERHGLLVHLAGYNGSYQVDRYKISRRGDELNTKITWEQFLRAYRLPETLLHPEVVTASYGAFLRGEFDAAVRNALVALETSMRTRGMTFSPKTTAVKTRGE